MSNPRVEQVFKVSGVPTYTFVEPKEYRHLIVSLRTAGRGLVVEGPSGIGKTTAVETALRVLGSDIKVKKLSARNRVDVEYIRTLPTLGDVGMVIVDDFHKLPDSIKEELANYLKTLADESREGIKLVIIGIRKAGESLISFASDLMSRIDVITFENNPEYKVRELIKRGEDALNTTINVAEDVVTAANGSFYITQLLCYEACILSDVLERSDVAKSTAISFEAAMANVWDRFNRVMYEPCRLFCQGTKMKSAGRAPYLHILKLLADKSGWSLSLRDAIRANPGMRGSISQVVEKGFLETLVKDKEKVAAVLHYDPRAKELTIEDPQFAFYIKNIPWSQFAREIGFSSVRFDTRYDFALSFAGADRDIAEALFEYLNENELEVFYDKNEQHRIMAQDVEEYLRPIYQSEASFVVCLLGPDYPKRIWTKFESDAFKNRFSSGGVIPVWFNNAPPGIFDESRRVGGITFDRGKPLNEEIVRIGDLLIKTIGESREASHAAIATPQPQQTLPGMDV